MPVSLGLDLGTTSISALAVNDNGTVVARSSCNHDAAIRGLPAGHAEQDPQVFVEAAIKVLRDVSGQLAQRPECLGLTGQMHGVLLLDESLSPVTNLITWQDLRSSESAAAGAGTWLEDFRSRCDEHMVSSTGCRLSPGYMGVTLYVETQRNNVPKTATCASFVADWVTATLTAGETIVTDRSNAAASGVFDLEHDCWSPALLAAGNLNPDWFPEVRESGTVVGSLSRDTAESTGLPHGLPLCTAIGDNQAAFLGSVPSGEPAIQINVGTGGQINWCVDSFHRVDGMDTRYLPHDRFMLVGAGLAGGDAYAWVNRTIGRWLRELGFELAPDDLYSRLTQLATTADSRGELRCEPLFRGTRQRPAVRGSFAGVTEDNFTLGNIARSVLVGVAEAMRWFFDNAGNARPKEFTRIIGSGNGLRRNPLLSRALEDVFSSEVWLPRHVEEAAFGAALLAGTSVGLWPNLEEAGNQIELDRA